MHISPLSFVFLQCVEDALHQSEKVNVALGTVNNCLEKRASSTIIFHPGYKSPMRGFSAAMIRLERPSNHIPVQLYQTGAVSFESCDGSSRLLQELPAASRTPDPLPLLLISSKCLVHSYRMYSCTHTCTGEAAAEGIRRSDGVACLHRFCPGLLIYLSASSCKASCTVEMR